MKKFTFPLFIGALAIIISLVILAYLYVLNPIYTQNNEHRKSIELKTTNREIVFKKHTNQEEVFSLELEITGQTKHNFTVALSNGKEFVHYARIKGNKVDFTYVNDWYSDSIIIQVTPEENENGKLDFSCRFISF